MPIPKKIHYCWFGKSEIPEKDLQCMESWRKFCPDYEIIEWNESNYDVAKNVYMAEAYQAKKWAFVSDYARLDILYQNGGIYLDTDVELLKNIDEFLQYEAFCGREQNKKIGLGLITGAEKGNHVIKELMDYYEGKTFFDEKGEMNLTPINEYTDAVLIPKGLVLEDQLQNLEGMTVFPSRYFAPIDYYTGLPKSKKVLKNAFSVHHYHASWIPDERRAYLESTRSLAKKYGYRRYSNGSAEKTEEFLADYHSVKQEKGTLRAIAWSMKNFPKVFFKQKERT